MKLLVLFITSSLMFSCVALAHPRCRTTDPTKPRHCHAPEAPEIEPDHSNLAHSIVGGLASVVAYDVARKSGLSKQHSLMLGVGTALVVSSLMESNTVSRDERLGASALGAVGFQLAFFDLEFE